MIISNMNKSWSDVKKYLKAQIDVSPMSGIQIIENSGLSRDAYYKIFAPGREDAPMRKSTVYGLSKTLKLDVEYVDGLPQFSNIQDTDNAIPIQNALEALHEVIEVAGGIEELSKKSHISISLLNTLISASEDDARKVPLNFLVRLGAVNGLSLQIDERGKACYSRGVEEHIYIPLNDEIEGDLHLDAFLDYYHYPKVVDPGLSKLFEDINIDKHQISESEKKELFLIATLRHSQSTMDHWISILYTIRDLSK